mgnify:CR=1 FL=1
MFFVGFDFVFRSAAWRKAYQVRRGRGRPGPLFGAGQKVIAGVFLNNMWSPNWGKRKSARTHKIYKSEGYWYILWMENLLIEVSHVVLHPPVQNFGEFEHI